MEFIEFTNIHTFIIYYNNRIYQYIVKTTKYLYRHTYTCIYTHTYIYILCFKLSMTIIANNGELYNLRDIRKHILVSDDCITLSQTTPTSPKPHPQVRLLTSTHFPIPVPLF